MAPRIVLNGVTAEKPAAKEGDACLALVPVTRPKWASDDDEANTIEAVVVAGGGLSKAAEESARFFLEMEEREAKAPTDEVGEAYDEDDDDEPDAQELFEAAYDLLQEVEDNLDHLLNRTAIDFSRRTKARLIQLGTDVSNFLNEHQDSGEAVAGEEIGEEA